MARLRSIPYKTSRLKQLRAFSETARLGNMSAAAERLNISQPSVSQLIRALELELDATLFERRGPRITLTAEGKSLHELARPLVDGFDALPDQFRAERSQIDHGEISIAAGESTILYLLPDSVQLYRRQYPGVHLHLRNVTGRDGLAMLREDRVDFAVGSMLDVPPDIRFQPLYSFAPSLIMPLGHPLVDKSRIELEDISPYGLILPPQRLTTFRLIDLIFHQRQVPYQVAMEAGGWEVIKRYVELGLGISIVTSICLRPNDRLVSRDLSHYFPVRTYGIVTRRGKVLSPQARRFIDLMHPAVFDMDETDGNWPAEQDQAQPNR